MTERRRFRPWAVAGFVAGYVLILAAIAVFLTRGGPSS
jgi:hypothetical protein